jgi:hypothetical protein
MFDPGMGKRRAEDFTPQHTGKGIICSIFGLSGDLDPTIDPGDSFTDNRMFMLSFQFSSF